MLEYIFGVIMVVGTLYLSLKVGNEKGNGAGCTVLFLGFMLYLWIGSKLPTDDPVTNCIRSCSKKHHDDIPAAYQACVEVCRRK